MKWEFIFPTQFKSNLILVETYSGNYIQRHERYYYFINVTVIEIFLRMRTRQLGNIDEKTEELKCHIEHQFSGVDKLIDGACEKLFE